MDNNSSPHTPLQCKQNGSFISLVPFMIFLIFYLGLSI